MAPIRPCLWHGREGGGHDGGPVYRTLSHWLELAIYPGISADHVADDALRRVASARVDRDGLDDAERVKPQRLTMRLVVEPQAQMQAASSGSPVVEPLVVGSGHLDLACPRCSTVVCRSVGNRNRFAGLLFDCPGCRGVVTIDHE